MLVLDDQHEWNGSRVYGFTRLSQAWTNRVEHNQGYAFKKDGQELSLAAWSQRPNPCGLLRDSLEFIHSVANLHRFLFGGLLVGFLSSNFLCHASQFLFDVL